ncbi:MAG: glycosyltransferase family 2 protein [Oscillatoria sp. PMC 1051.18]|nr:glycosyltransferase family 2 protein [Oscillatoria sp. PMC 1050.18]MEC5030166.1 glycosyltransferase family 2 protein [Oscillatoria sp. PMC 1051.18]
MLYPIKVVDIELNRPLETIVGLEGYKAIKGLVRLHNVPIGYVNLPITNDICPAETISKIILQEHSWTIIQHLLQNSLAKKNHLNSLRLEDLFDIKPAENEEESPLVTVAVCSRDRAEDLDLCLSAITKLNYPNLDILIVDNAPSNDATKNLVKDKYPQYRYVCEPRPGLDWARNRAIVEAKGAIIAYTDDDVIVDSDWVKNLVRVFLENPEVMAVTGLVVPYELETEAQILFEKQGGFGKGFVTKWYRVKQREKIPWYLLGTGNFGTGANMAYRRQIFDQVGYFDPALDVGTVTNGAGDLEMFFRILKAGHPLVYEPKALIRHRHRREYNQLKKQLINNGSVFSYFVCAIMAYPEELLSFMRLGITWLLTWHCKRLLISLLHPTQFPRELIWAELRGCLIGLIRYPQAKKNAAQIIATQGNFIPDRVPRENPQNDNWQTNQTGVVTVELTEAIQPLTQITNYQSVHIFCTWQGKPLGSADITNNYQIISTTRLIEAIVTNLGLKLLAGSAQISQDLLWSQAVTTLQQHYQPKKAAANTKLPAHVSVSILVGTYDRPKDLRNCLNCLVAQNSPHSVEIIVVDNHPDSGITPPVVAEFPNVKLVSETRQGVAYARNAGILASSGEIIVTTDDDVTMPKDWLENLIANFSRADVMCISGNILPLKLDTESQKLFEKYGGLGRGFEYFEVSSEWFERSPLHVVPTWELGGTANAAFRAKIFHDPEIGLMDETLGPGMPSGVGEDIYLFYKILKAGYTIIYEPTAYVWHRHRQDMSALRRQLYNYSKGFVSYQLTTLLRDRDWRVLPNLFFYLPGYHLKRIYHRLRGWNDYPISLSLLEITGNILGPLALWQSYQRVNQQGRTSSQTP